MANRKQLIPGSILIDERGEINNRSKENNKTVSSIVSNNPVNPNNDKQSKVNKDSLSYFAPTTIQPGIPATSESNTRQNPAPRTPTTGPPMLDRQKTPSESLSKDNKPWVNPYWPSFNQTNPPKQSPKNSPRTSTSPATNSKPGTWVNPYWGTKPLGPSGSLPNEPRQTPDVRGASASPATQQSAKPVVLSHAYESQQSALSEIDFLPTPSFYERIYPLHVLSSSSQPNMNNKLPTSLAQDSTKATQSQGNTQPNTPFGIGNRGGPGHSTSPMGQQYTSNQGTTSMPSWQPAASTPLPLYPNSNTASSLPTGSILRVITKLDLDTIQEAFDTIATNPHSIPVIPSTLQLFQPKSHQFPHLPGSQSPVTASQPEQRQSFPFATSNLPSTDPNSRSPPFPNFLSGNYPSNPQSVPIPNGSPGSYPVNTQHPQMPSFLSNAHSPSMPGASPPSYPSNTQPQPMSSFSTDNYPMRTQYPPMTSFPSANYPSNHQSPPMSGTPSPSHLANTQPQYISTFSTGNYPPNAQSPPLTTFSSGNYPVKTNYPQMPPFSAGAYPITLHCVPVPNFSSASYPSNAQSNPFSNFSIGNYDVISNPVASPLPKQRSIVLI